MAKLASKGNQLCLGSVCAIPSLHEGETPLYGAQGEELNISQFRKVASSECDGMRGPCGRLCSECTDKTACHAEKLAAVFGVKEAAHKKLSEIVKNIPTGVFSMQHLPAMESREEDLPDDVLDDMADYPLPQSLGTATSAGMVLKPHEFQRIVLIRMGERPIADQLSSSHRMFRPVSRFDDSRLMMDELIEAILERLMPHLPSRTAFGPHFHLRARHLEHGGGMKKTLPTRESVQHSLLDKISAAYNGYRRNVLTKLSQAREEVLGDSRLREAVLGDGLAKMFTKHANTSEPVTLNSVAYMMGAHLSNRSSLLSPAVAEAIAVSNPWLREEHSA